MIDVHEPLQEICRRLGIEPTLCARLEIRPRKITATLFDPPKRIGEDGEPVTVELSYEVET